MRKTKFLFRSPWSVYSFQIQVEWCFKVCRISTSFLSKSKIHFLEAKKVKLLHCIVEIIFLLDARDHSGSYTMRYFVTVSDSNYTKIMSDDCGDNIQDFACYLHRFSPLCATHTSCKSYFCLSKVLQSTNVLFILSDFKRAISMRNC